MRVLIFTEGGSEIGYGHIIRCSSIYEELKKRGIDVRFIINGDFQSTEILRNTPVENAYWYSHAYLIELIRNDDYCVVDSYIADEDTYQLISELAKKCLYLDDYNRIKYPKGTVITPSLIKKEHINDSTLTHYVAGPHVICLRNSFASVEARSINAHLSNVLITLGGSNLTTLIIEITSGFCERYPNISFHLILGKTITKVEIEKLKFDNLFIYKDLSADKVKELMVISDLAITGAGQTIYELIATQTPFIPIKVAENQQSIVNNLLKLNLSDLYIDSLTNNFLMHLFNSFEVKKAYSSRINQFESLNNVIDLSSIHIIVNYLLVDDVVVNNFRIRKAIEEDTYNVYSLSNDPHVRAVSMNQDQIDWSNHSKWFYKVINSEHYLFLIIEDLQGNFVGQIRFSLENNKAIISISVKEEYRGKGLSLSILLQSIKELIQSVQNVTKIVAYIRHDNLASRLLFERAGFTLMSFDNKDLNKYILTVGV